MILDWVNWAVNEPINLNENWSSIGLPAVLQHWNFGLVTGGLDVRFHG